MGMTTTISWCDSTCNLMSGCDGCELWNPSAGVRHCYAGTLVGRYGGKKGWPESFDKPAIFVGRLKKSLMWPDLTGKDRPAKPWLNGRPRVVFLCDMGDPFTESLPDDWLAQALAQLAASPHIWMLLTKRPSRFRQFAEKCGPLPRNIWGGVTVTTQATVRRLTELQKIDLAKRFVSIEPLLGPIDIRENLADKTNPLSLCVVGGESGPGFRDYETEWATSVRDQCVGAGVAFFHKQKGGRRPGTGVELEGKVWHQFPALC